MPRTLDFWAQGSCDTIIIVSVELGAAFSSDQRLNRSFFLVRFQSLSFTLISMVSEATPWPHPLSRSIDILQRRYDTVDLCAIIAKFNYIPMESRDAKNGSAMVTVLQ